MNARFLLLAFLLVGCRGRLPFEEETLLRCETSAQCPNGAVCALGTCRLGDCDPALEEACDTQALADARCCDALERCSDLSFACEPDPSVPVDCDAADPTCVQCTQAADCESGQFCSSGLCLGAAGREACTSSFQCAAGEHCDRTVFLCVPKRACSLCGPEYPHLCCAEEEICSEEVGGFCVTPTFPECADDNDCSPGLTCDGLQRCVQCNATIACGPGLLCDVERGECVSDDTCTIDDDCSGNERCATATNSCVLPECQGDADCIQDPRFVCDVGVFRCALPAPVCTGDVDEENDDPVQATPLSDLAGGAVLCRGDTDVLSFPVVADRRYTAVVDFGGSGQAGVFVTMLNADFIVESTRTFAVSEASVAVAGVTGPGEAGTFYVSIEGNNDDRDQWSYFVSVEESEPGK